MPINVGQAVGYIDLDTSNFSKGLKSAWKDLKTFADESESLTKRTNALGKGLNGIGTTLTKNLTVPITAAGAASLKAGIEFESAFAGIRKTVDATETEFEQLREGILDMARDMPQSASELAAVGEIAGQLGIETENILDFTKAMVMLGDTTNLSSTEAAISLSRLANITGMSQDNFDRLGSSIVKLGNNFATTEAEIASMALNISSAGTQIGLSESEILGFAAALSSVGIQAELGGTALSKVMIQMQLAVETGGTALHNFATVANMSVDDFKDAFQKDAASAIQAFIVGLKDTERLGDSTIKILNDMGIKEVRLRDTLLRAANASDVLNGAIEMSNKAWDENSALVDEANKRYETTESQLKILWNNVVELGIRIADVLLPAFNKIVKSLQNFVSWLAELDEDLITAMVTIAGIVAVVGPVISIIGKLIISVTKVVTAIKGCTAAMTALKAITTALTGPVGLVITAVGLLTAAIVLNVNKTSLLSKEYRELNEKIKDNKNSYEDKREEIDKDSDAMMSNAMRAKELYNEMVDLSTQEMDTATKVSILTAMQKELKELVPDLVVEIDKETGALKTNKQTVDNLIQSYVDLAIVKRFEDKYSNETQRFLDATEARKDALENIKRVEDEIKENQDWFDNLNFLGQSFGREGYLAKNSDLKKELSDFEKIEDEQNKIIEESKTNMRNFETEKEEFTKMVYESLGFQISSNNNLIESNEKLVDSTNNTINSQIDANKKANESAQQTKILTEEEKKAIEKAEKEKEKAFEAEKDRYDKLKDTTQKYWDDITDIYAKSNEEILKIEDERKQQVEEVTKEYENILQERNKELRNSYGLFDEFVKADEDSLSGNQLLKNLKSQLNGIKEWRQNLDELAERGVTQGLLDELKELGPKSAIEIENLTKLSDKKLQEYIQTWQELNDETFRQAVIDVEPEKRAMEAKIDEINADAKYKIDLVTAEVDKDIDALTKKYITAIEELGVKVVPEAKDTGIEIIKAIEIGVDETEESLFTKLQNLKDEVSSIVRSIKREVASAERAADSIDGSHKSGLDYVPYDGYVAQLHKGERVLTEQENKKYNEANVKTSGSQTLNVNFGGSLGQLIRVLKPEFELDDNRGGVQY